MWTTRSARDTPRAVNPAIGVGLMATLPPKLDVPAVRRRVLAWYRAHRRDLPWRKLSIAPYETLVVEMMAQQTQITTVLPYYRRFLKRFPTVRSLAQADIDSVLPYWAGLGYYRRCHHLHAAARMIVGDFSSRWPRDVETLQTLPVNAEIAKFRKEAQSLLYRKKPLCGPLRNSAISAFNPLGGDFFAASRIAEFAGDYSSRTKSPRTPPDFSSN